MATNKISEGKTIVITAGAAYSSGDLIDLGNGLCGIAVDDIENGAEGVVMLEGTYTVPKKDTTDVFAVGSPFKIDTKKADLVAVGSATTTAQLNVICGHAVAASNSAATTVEVVINK